MVLSTKVEWADETLNPWAGCTKTGTAGCVKCCALPFARRLQGQGHPKYQGVTKDGEWTGRVNFYPLELEKLRRWRKPRRVFVQIMGDAFHNNIREGDLVEVLSACLNASRHTFLFLTKRPGRMASTWKRYQNILNARENPHLWLGVSVSTQDDDWRIRELLNIPAAARWVSYEPALGGVNYTPFLNHPTTCRCPTCFHRAFDAPNRRGIDWLVCGAETGPGKRPFKQEWAEDAYRQCRAAGVPFFGKVNGFGEPLAVGGKVVREYPDAPAPGQGETG